MSDKASNTDQLRVQQYNDRWTTFGENTGIKSISDVPSPEQLKRYELFEPYTEKQLQRILPDISIAEWRAGAALFEEGTYIDLAFYIVEGEVEVSTGRAGEAPVEAAPIMDLSRTAVVPTGVAQETRMAPAEQKTVAPKSKPKKKVRPNEIRYLAAADFDLAREETKVLGKGEFFGEIGAMSGWPQSMTVVTKTDCTLVQIRLPALQALRTGSADLKKRLDKIYRERSLAAHLLCTPLFSGCGSATIEALKEQVELVSCRPRQAIVSEGDPVDAMYLVRSGFVKLAQRYLRGDLVVSYLSKGMVLGDVEQFATDSDRWCMTATSVEHSELVKIPSGVIEEISRTEPVLAERLWGSGLERVKEISASRRDVGRSEFIEAALTDGYVEGNSILVIDLDVCTRCDDCVRGCASTHGGRPRFIREGDKYENLLITKSCYHCRDPVCLVGCPTGAIRRSGLLEVVEIVEDICIGCATCSENCPYDQIVMHDTGKKWPENATPKINRGKPRLVASKCDLCKSTNHGPACVANCPQNCAYRVSSLDEFEQVLNRRKEGRGA